MGQRPEGPAGLPGEELQHFLQVHKERAARVLRGPAKGTAVRVGVREGKAEPREEEVEDIQHARRHQMGLTTKISQVNP